MSTEVAAVQVVTERVLVVEEPIPAAVVEETIAAVDSVITAAAVAETTELVVEVEITEITEILKNAIDSILR